MVKPDKLKVLDVYPQRKNQKIASDFFFNTKRSTRRSSAILFIQDGYTGQIVSYNPNNNKKNKTLVSKTSQPVTQKSKDKGKNVAKASNYSYSKLKTEKPVKKEKSSENNAVFSSPKNNKKCYKTASKSKQSDALKISDNSSSQKSIKTNKIVSKKSVDKGIITTPPSQNINPDALKQPTRRAPVRCSSEMIIVKRKVGRPKKLLSQTTQKTSDVILNNSDRFPKRMASVCNQYSSQAVFKIPVLPKNKTTETTETRNLPKRMSSVCSKRSSEEVVFKKPVGNLKKLASEIIEKSSNVVTFKNSNERTKRTTSVLPSKTEFIIPSLLPKKMASLITENSSEASLSTKIERPKRMMSVATEKSSKASLNTKIERPKRMMSVATEKSSKPTNSAIGRPKRMASVIPEKSSKTTNTAIGRPKRMASVIPKKSSKPTNSAIGRPKRMASVIPEKSSKTTNKAIGRSKRMASVIPEKSSKATNTAVGRPKRMKSVIPEKSSKTTNTAIGRPKRMASVIPEKSSKASLNTTIGRPKRMASVNIKTSLKNKNQIPISRPKRMPSVISKKTLTVKTNSSVSRSESFEYKKSTNKANKSSINPFSPPKTKKMKTACFDNEQSVSELDETTRSTEIMSVSEQDDKEHRINNVICLLDILGIDETEQIINDDLFESFFVDEIIPAMENFKDFEENKNTTIRFLPTKYESIFNGNTIIQIPIDPMLNVFPSQILNENERQEDLRNHRIQQTFQRFQDIYNYQYSLFNQQWLNISGGL